MNTNQKAWNIVFKSMDNFYSTFTVLFSHFLCPTHGKKVYKNSSQFGIAFLQVFFLFCNTSQLIRVCHYIILASLVPRSGLSDETTWANKNCLTWICSAGVWQTPKTAWFMLTADRAYSCAGGASWVIQLCLFQELQPKQNDHQLHTISDKCT